jgi:hypothetical protein
MKSVQDLAQIASFLDESFKANYSRPTDWSLVKALAEQLMIEKIKTETTLRLVDLTVMELAHIVAICDDKLSPPREQKIEDNKAVIKNHVKLNNKKDLSKIN